MSVRRLAGAVLIVFENGATGTERATAEEVGIDCVAKPPGDDVYRAIGIRAATTVDILTNAPTRPPSPSLHTDDAQFSL
jgi:hypothetical protein